MSKKNTISFLVFNDNSGKSRSFKLTINSIVSMFVVVILGLVLLGVGVFFSFSEEIDQLSYNKLKQDNDELNSAIKVIDTNYESLEVTILDLIEKEEQLELLLGKATIKKKK
jgi:Tfp pilus assembly protein PilO